MRRKSRLKVVKATIQILCDNGLFDNYDKTDQVLKKYLTFDVNERHRSDLDSINVNIQ